MTASRALHRPEMLSDEWWQMLQAAELNDVPDAAASALEQRARLTLTPSQGPWHRHPDTPETFIVLKGVPVPEVRGGTFRNKAANSCGRASA